MEAQAQRAARQKVRRADLTQPACQVNRTFAGQEIKSTLVHELAVADLQRRTVLLSSTGSADLIETGDYGSPLRAIERQACPASSKRCWLAGPSEPAA